MIPSRLLSRVIKAGHSEYSKSINTSPDHLYTLLKYSFKEEKPTMYLKPQFTVLLQNNDAPAEKTILEVAESLKVPLNELREIEKEIQRLNELMEIMNAKRRSIQKIIDDHNVILAPARRLPQDVLHEIFLNCLPTHRNPNVEFSESPLLLTRICSSWRAIALSSPRMWSKVHIVLPRFSSGDTARRQRFADAVLLKCNILRKWLGQSGTFPLSLSITHPGACAMEYEPARAMFNLLLSFADRWSDVQLSMSEDVYHKLQGKMDPTKFSSLKSLDITLHTKYYGNNVHSPPIQLLAAPNLCRLAISAIWTTLRMTRNLVQPIWNNITHITLSSITDKYLPLLLKKSYNLVFGDFRVNPSPWDAEPLVDQEETPLPRLESLSIDDSGAQETMDALFNAIKAPALSKLSYRWSYPSGIHDDDDPSMPLPAPVIPLLKNSALISNLLLDGYLSSKDTQECLRHAAGVTHVAFGKPLLRVGDGLLHMDSDTPPDNFDLRILCVGSSGVTPLPRLESLEAYQLSSLTDDDLLDLITSRINASLRGETAALKFIKIDFLRRRQKDITEEVSRLAKEAGIEVKLDLTYTAATS